MTKVSLLVVFVLDLQKSFDTFNHEFLPAKLQHYGVRAVSLNSFIRQLTEDRTQLTEVNNALPQILPTENGALQGSVLGPLLFLVYINDLHNVVQYSDIHHFADDTNLLNSTKSLKDINKKGNFELKKYSS